MLVLMLYNLTCYWFINSSLLTITAAIIFFIWFGAFVGPQLPLVASLIAILTLVFLLSIL